MQIVITNFSADGCDTRVQGMRLGVPDQDDTVPVEPVTFVSGDSLNYRAAGQRRCIGYRELLPEGGFVEVPCRTARPISKGTQCYPCSRADESWQIHNTPREKASPALVSYLDRPHFLYIAGFADGSLKVGTSRSMRRLSRWVEQGAVMTVRVGEYADGWAVRQAENMASKRGDIKQAVRTATKAKAFQSPLSVQELADCVAHAATDITNRLDAYGLRGAPVAQELGTEGAPLPDVLSQLEGMDPWVNPCAVTHLGQHLPAYPRSLTSGEHHLELVGMVGSTGFVRMTEAEDGALNMGEDPDQIYVANLATLKAHELDVME